MSRIGCSKFKKGRIRKYLQSVRNDERFTHLFDKILYLSGNSLGVVTLVTQLSV